MLNKIKQTKVYLRYRNFKKNISEFIKFALNCTEFKEQWIHNSRYLTNLKYEIYDEIKNNKVQLEMPKIMTIEDTLNEIINNKKSICRYGDGEFALLTGVNFNSKAYFNMQQNSELISRLRKILTTNNKNIIVCLADIFGSLSEYNENVQKIARQHIINFRKPLQQYLNFNKHYGNANITRFHTGYSNFSISEKYFSKWKNIWNDKDICIIEGEGTQLGVGNDLFINARHIERIICPAENSFAKYNKILEEAKKQSKDKLILIALGMTATVLAYDLTELGYWAIDIGHLDLEYEAFIHKSDKLIPIAGKYANDLGIQNYTISKNKEYLQQITTKIKG